MAVAPSLAALLDRSAFALAERRRSRPVERPPIVHPMPDLLPSAGQPLHLTEADRVALAALMAAHPGATNGQLRIWLRRRTGRSISKSSMLRAMREGYRLRGTGKPGSHLDAEQLRTLESLARDAAPRYCRSEIRREFIATTGRPITVGSVSRFLVVNLGLPKLGRGDYSGGFDRRRRVG